MIITSPLTFRVTVALLLDVSSSASTKLLVSMSKREGMGCAALVFSDLGIEMPRTRRIGDERSRMRQGEGHASTT